MADAESPLRDLSGQAEISQVAEIGMAHVPPGGLYVAYAAVAARAVAGAVAERDSRHMFYLRRVVLMAVLFVGIGVTAIVAALALFG
jgi:hypothetical protein